MKRFKKSRHAFSLVEVVISLAVVSIGVISILGLFGVAFTSVRDVANQSEAVGVVQALPSYFQTNGFSTVYTSIQAGTANNIYAYTSTNTITGSAAMIVDTSGAADMTAAAVATRSGRLFNIVLTASINAPVAATVDAAPTYASGTTAGSTPATYGDAILPINVKIYSVPQLATPITHLSPVVNYDTVLSR